MRAIGQGGHVPHEYMKDGCIIMSDDMNDKTRTTAITTDMSTAYGGQTKRHIRHQHFDS